MIWRNEIAAGPRNASELSSTVVLYSGRWATMTVVMFQALEGTGAGAAVALGVTAERIARHTDSVTFCVSKGLSAPVGSLLCGTKEFITRARGFRRMLGGNLRQAGMLAAAGIVALDRMVERLSDDHATAKQLADGLHRIAPSLVDPKSIATNIVRVDTTVSGWSAEKWATALQFRDVRVSPGGAMQLRFVTHRHISPADVEATLQTFRDLWREAPGQPTARAS